MINKISLLRLLVLYLGEKSQQGWWQTDFFSLSGNSFLKPVFPKSIHLAKYTGSLTAALKVHEEFIGLGDVIHLFHLPESVEQQVFHYIQENADELINILNSHDVALEQLAEIAKNKQAAHNNGPVALASSTNGAINQKLIEQIAAAYLQAFKTDIQIFPYSKVEH